MVKLMIGSICTKDKEVVSSLIGSDLTKLTVDKLPQNFDSEMGKQDERICVHSLSRGKKH